MAVQGHGRCGVTGEASARLLIAPALIASDAVVCLSPCGTRSAYATAFWHPFLAQAAPAVPCQVGARRGSLGTSRALGSLAVHHAGAPIVGSGQHDAPGWSFDNPGAIAR